MMALRNCWRTVEDRLPPDCVSLGLAADRLFSLQSQTMMHSKRDSAPTLFSILRETPPFPLQDDIPESSSRKAPCDKSRHKYRSSAAASPCLQRPDRLIREAFCRISQASRSI